MRAALVSTVIALQQSSSSSCSRRSREEDVVPRQVLAWQAKTWRRISSQLQTSTLSHGDVRGLTTLERERDNETIHLSGYRDLKIPLPREVYPVTAYQYKYYYKSVLIISNVYHNTPFYAE